MGGLRNLFLALTLITSFGLAVTVAQEDKKSEDKKTEDKEKDPPKDKENEKEKKPEDEKILNKTIGEWIVILRTHESPKFRRAALIALEYGNQAHRTGLTAVLQATDQEREKEVQVRVDAIKLLGRLEPKTQGALRTIVSVLQNDKADSVREAAANVLGNEKYVKDAETYLGAIAGQLKDETHKGTRIAIASSIRNMQTGARPAFPILADAAKNPKEDLLVRLAAIHVIARHAESIAQWVPLFLEVLNDANNSPSLRELALDGLGRTKSEAPEVIQALCKVLTDKNVELRKAAAVALVELGEKCKAGWPTIKDRLKSTDTKKGEDPVEADSTIRNHLIRLTGVLAKANPEGVTVLAERAKSDNATENRIAAIQELAELAALAKSSLPVLEELAKIDARAAIREAAAKAVAKIRGG